MRREENNSSCEAESQFKGTASRSNIHSELGSLQNFPVSSDLYEVPAVARIQCDIFSKQRVVTNTLRHTSHTQPSSKLPKSPVTGCKRGTTEWLQSKFAKTKGWMDILLKSNYQGHPTLRELWQPHLKHKIGGSGTPGTNAWWDMPRVTKKTNINIPIVSKSQIHSIL